MSQPETPNDGGKDEEIKMNVLDEVFTFIEELGRA